MEEITKNEFDVLKKKLEVLEKSHRELLGTLMNVTDGLRSFVDTQRMPTINREKDIATRMQGHYSKFNDAYLNISRLKNR